MAEAQSAFDQSQDTWKNPLEQVSQPPAFDYNKAVEAKKGVLQKEIPAVEKAMAGQEAAMAKYGGVADRKLQQLEQFDSDQIKPWNEQEEKQKYQQNPFDTFSSMAMVASLGLAAFTKTPFINSMNAMAGVINGTQDRKDKEYGQQQAVHGAFQHRQGTGWRVHLDDEGARRTGQDQAGQHPGQVRSSAGFGVAQCGL